MALDPELEAILAAKGVLTAPPLHSLGVEGARSISGVLRPGDDPGPQCARELTQRVPGGVGPIPVLYGESQPSTIVLWVHGGGWTLGSAAASVPFARRLAHAWQTDVAVVDYRLAPEHPYPAGIDDVEAAWQAIAQAHPGRKIVLAGDSAGANLALAAAARRPAAAALDAIVAFYPVVDPRRAFGSHADPQCQLVLPAETMGWFWDLYAPDGSASWSAPLQWESISALPPMVIVTAEHDVLRDEGQALADHLRAGGVQVEHSCWPGQVHGFVTLTPRPAAAVAALDWAGQMLMRALAPPD